jgi:hypothetical protein
MAWPLIAPVLTLQLTTYKGLIQGSMADLKSRTEQNRKEKKRKEQKKGPAARSSQQDVNSG